MTVKAAAVGAAKRLWSAAADGTGSPDEVSAAAGRVCTQLRGALGRWIGADGHRALVLRALELTRVEHRALRELSCLGGEDALIAATVRSYGQFEVADGMVAFLATLIELLGRIVGDGMAVRLVEQSAIPGPRAVVGAESQGAQDG